MCGSEPATLLQTNVKNGDSLSVGDSCILVFYLTAATEMLGMMPAENVTAYAKALAPILDKMAEHADFDGDGAAGQAPDAADSDAAPVTADTAAGDD
jgi:hypothetical protein